MIQIRMTQWLFFGLVLLSSVTAVGDDDDLIDRANELIGPIPASSAPDDAMAALGAKLFTDPRLSGDNSMSCATCHRPDHAFTDGKDRSTGANGEQLARNTPTLLNVSLHTTFAWDGRGTSLESQSLEPIADRNEMNQDLDALVLELTGDSEYQQSFERVFGGPATIERVGAALAEYQRTLVTGNSPFDRFLRGDADALSPLAKQGLELFMGDSECITCHLGPRLSDGKHYRLGIGRQDKGRGAITHDTEDNYRFRVPTLRNVARTAPYMHDGSKRTLNDVVVFYFRHSGVNGQDGLPLDFEPLLGQSYADIDALVAFLEALSDEDLDGDASGAP